MHPWLLILILTGSVILLIHPSREDFDWYQGLRQPAWLRFGSSIPMIRLLIQVSFYLSSLVSWQARQSWSLVLATILLLAIGESRLWLTCRSRRLGNGAVLCLLGWGYGLILAAALRPVVPLAAALLIPYLVWAPVEALISRDMHRINKDL